MLNNILEHNKRFVEQRKAERLDEPISGHAQKGVMVFTCMDTRLVELLEPAMGFERGDIKILKNAGNIIRDGCDEIIRCIAVGTVLMGLSQVYVVGHKDCGMAKLTPQAVKDKMIARGIREEDIESINIKEWIGILKDEKQNVIEAVKKIKESPFVPKDIEIHGLVMDPNSGELEVIC
ncbi:beta-class carbonic anhydrase [Lutispora thermophila]|uniref:carbonic anhydrase n=1 Tax=Lutispora thermophila DSM 19022 TaxID=1122184 RepID=A0A1M6AV07_9FIRM|nr:carbonic anhydrase [Lutispora thermophila]SHI40306.1 carbonic anhydrase [Lutispora thermophila DSM 19022]